MARLLHQRQYLTKEGDIVEAKIWEIEKSGNFPHGLKYSFVYIHNGVRVFGYDNERAKGDHVHIFEDEEQYFFTNLKTIYHDFEEGVKKIRRILYGNKEN